MGCAGHKIPETDEQRKERERNTAKAYHPDAFVSVSGNICVHNCANWPLVLYLTFFACLAFVWAFWVFFGFGFYFAVAWCVVPSCLLRCVSLEEQAYSQATFAALLGDPTRVGSAGGNSALGVFFMRKNRMGDGFFCMDRGYWESPDKAWVSGYADNVWMNKKTFWAWLSFALAKFFDLRFVYEFGQNTSFSDARREATIRPWVFDVFKCTLPQCLLYMRMTDVSEKMDGTLWERSIRLLGVRLPSHYLEQVTVNGKVEVDEHGETSGVQDGSPTGRVDASEGKYWSTVKDEAPKMGLCFPGADPRRPNGPGNTEGCCWGCPRRCALAMQRKGCCGPRADPEEDETSRGP